MPDKLIRFDSTPSLGDSPLLEQWVEELRKVSQYKPRTLGSTSVLRGASIDSFLYTDPNELLPCASYQADLLGPSSSLRAAAHDLPEFQPMTVGRALRQWMPFYNFHRANLPGATP